MLVSIQQDYPKAICVKCPLHALNLCVVSAHVIQMMIKFDGTRGSPV